MLYSYKNQLITICIYFNKYLEKLSIFSKEERLNILSIYEKSSINIKKLNNVYNTHY